MKNRKFYKIINCPLEKQIHLAENSSMNIFGLCLIFTAILFCFMNQPIIAFVFAMFFIILNVMKYFEYRSILIPISKDVKLMNMIGSKYSIKEPKTYCFEVITNGK